MCDKLEPKLLEVIENNVCNPVINSKSEWPKL